MKWRKEERITITHLQKMMMARMMISFGLAIFLHGYSHLKRENNKKRQNRQGWREAQPLPIKNRRPQCIGSISLPVCMSVECVLLAVKRLSILRGIYNIQ